MKMSKEENPRESVTVRLKPDSLARCAAFLFERGYTPGTVSELVHVVVEIFTRNAPPSLDGLTNEEAWNRIESLNIVLPARKRRQREILIDEVEIDLLDITNDELEEAVVNWNPEEKAQ